jgi:hypothetical protein
VDGQPCTLSKYRASTNYQTFSQRIQYTCTRPNKQPYSNIEVVSGSSTRGTRTRRVRRSPDQGKDDADAGAVQERLIRIWASPQGAPKAAWRDDRTLLARRQPGHARRGRRREAGQHVVSWDSGQGGRDLPIPACRARPATATLDAKYMTEKVVVTQGATTTEFTYSNYRTGTTR